MTWTDPVVLSQSFDTNDMPTEANFDSLFNDFLSLMHPLEAPTTADNDVTNTVTETTLYSVVVPANALGANGRALMELEGDWLYNNLTSDTVTLRVKFGGTTIVGDAARWASLTGAGRGAWTLAASVSNRGATNAQLVTAVLTWSPPGGGVATAGVGNWDEFNGGRSTSGPVQNTAAIDTTVDQTLLVSVQWSVASANDSWRRRWARTLIGQN